MSVGLQRGARERAIWTHSTANWCTVFGLLAGSDVASATAQVDAGGTVGGGEDGGGAGSQMPIHQYEVDGVAGGGGQNCLEGVSAQFEI